MTQAGVFERVRAILTEVLMLDPESVHPQARILDDLGAESIDLLDLRFRLEKAFGFRITDQDLARAFGPITVEEYHQVFTMGALCEYVHTRLEQEDG